MPNYPNQPLTRLARGKRQRGSRRRLNTAQGTARKLGTSAPSSYPGFEDTVRELQQGYPNVPLTSANQPPPVEAQSTPDVGVDPRLLHQQQAIAHRAAQQQAVHQQRMAALRGGMPPERPSAEDLIGTAQGQAEMGRRTHGRTQFDVPTGATNPLGGYPTEFPNAPPTLMDEWSNLPPQAKHTLMAGYVPHGMTAEAAQRFPQFGEYPQGRVMTGGSTAHYRPGQGISLVGPGVRQEPFSPVAPLGQERAQEIARSNLAEQTGLPAGSPIEELRATARQQREQELRRREARRKMYFAQKSGDRRRMMAAMREWQDTMAGAAGGTSSGPLDITPAETLQDFASLFPSDEPLGGEELAERVDNFLTSGAITEDQLPQLYKFLLTQGITTEEDVKSSIAELGTKGKFSLLSNITRHALFGTPYEAQFPFESDDAYRERIQRMNHLRKMRGLKPISPIMRDDL